MYMQLHFAFLHKSSVISFTRIDNCLKHKVDKVFQQISSNSPKGKYGVGVGSERRRLSPEIETERVVAYPRKEKTENAQIRKTW